MGLMGFLSVVTLFVLATWLERLHARPFVASLWGHLLARSLGATCLGASLDAVRRSASPPLSADAYSDNALYDYVLYEVSALPAVGFRAAGQTWGEVVLVVHGHASLRLLAHEACHVAQYRRLTSLGFWGLYLTQWLGGLVRRRDLFAAYWEIGLEAEARGAAEVHTG